MGTLTALPALQVQKPESPLDTYMRIAGLKSLTQEGQLRDIQVRQAQMQLEDEQKMRDSWLRSGGDWDLFESNMQKAGVLPKNILTMQQALLDLKKKGADLDEVTQKNTASAHDAIRGQMMSVINGPDAQKQQAWDSTLGNLEKAGALKPGQVDHAYPGDDIATGVANHFALGSQLAKEAIDARTANARAQQAKTAADEFAAKQNPQSPLYSPTAASLALAASGGPSAQQGPAQTILAGETAHAADVAGAEAKAKLPSEIEARRQGAIAQVQAQTQLYAGNAALARVPPHLVPAATKEATDLGTKFANLYGQFDKLKMDLAAAKTGDEVANAFVPVATALGSNSFAGTKRLAPSEVQALGPRLGSLGRQLNTMLDKAGSGTLPPASIAEFSSMVDRLSSAATEQYKNGLAVVNQNYGSNFQPVTMQAASTVRMRAPNGQEKDVPAELVDHYKSLGAKEVSGAAPSVPAPARSFSGIPSGQP